jgi:hypothetical protein
VLPFFPKYKIPNFHLPQRHELIQTKFTHNPLTKKVFSLSSSPNAAVISATTPLEPSCTELYRS